MVEKIERRRNVEILLLFFGSVDAWCYFDFETQIMMMTERIRITRVSREIVFMTVREINCTLCLTCKMSQMECSHLKLPLDIAF